MAKVKISALPQATALSSSDLLTAVSSSVSTKITVQTLSSNLTQVSSSISASYAVTASYALNGGGGGGTNGTSGTSGQSGSSGTSGQSGTSGSSGTSGQSGSSGTSGQSGSSGTSGTGFNTVSGGTTIDRVLTSDGTSNGAVAETKFTFDGNTLILTGSLIVTGSGQFRSGSLAVGSVTASTTIGRIDASNDIVAFSTSDIRYKTNIVPISNATNKVNQISGVHFDWIEDISVHGNSGRDVGVIAQELEAILPEVVTTRDNGVKAVKYDKIVPLLIEAIKDLQRQINELKVSK
jgi:hypothetical protein